jgi:hypothetical protein
MIEKVEILTDYQAYLCLTLGDRIIAGAGRRLSMPVG